MTKARILIVDDEPDVLSFIQHLLERRGYEVEIATSGLRALAIVAERPPALVITDLRMPELDGMGLLAMLREQGRKLASIVLTAADDIQSAVRAMQAGADDYLSKPVDVAALFASVERALQRTNERIAVESPKTATSFDGIAVPGAAMADIERYAIVKTLEAVEGSTSRAAEMLDISVRTIQYRLHEYGSVAPAKKR